MAVDGGAAGHDPTAGSAERRLFVADRPEHAEKHDARVLVRAPVVDAGLLEVAAAGARQDDRVVDDIVSTTVR